MEFPYVNEKFLIDLFNKVLPMNLKVIVVMTLMIVAWVVAGVMIRRLEKYWKSQQGSLEDQKRTGTSICARFPKPIAWQPLSSGLMFVPKTG